LKTQDLPIVKEIKKPLEEKKKDDDKKEDKDKDRDKDRDKDKDNTAAAIRHFRVRDRQIQVSARYEIFSWSRDNDALGDERHTWAGR